MIPLIVLSVAVAMMAIEAAAPGRAWPQVMFWRLRALIFNSIQAAMVWLAGVDTTHGANTDPATTWPLCGRITDNPIDSVLFLV